MSQSRQYSIPDRGEYQAVRSGRRFSREHPCPICGGHPALPHGLHLRCWGYLSADGEQAFCTRPEVAGYLREFGPSEANGAYLHWLTDLCGCGVRHDTGEQPQAQAQAEAWAVDIFTTAESPQSRCIAQHTYALRDADGSLAGYHHRDVYLTTHPDGSESTEKDCWWSDHGERRITAMPLYGLATLLRASSADRVIVVEGEVAADALLDHGILAVGTVTGAHVTPSAASLAPLVGHRVILWPDRDLVGERHMERVAERIPDTTTRILHWEGAQEHDDAADFFARGGTLDALDALIDAATAVTAATQSLGGRSIQ